MIDPALGVSENYFKEDFNIYPNPANGNVVIKLKLKSESDLTLNIYNSIGEKIFTEITKKNRVELNCSDFVSGIYFSEVTTDNFTMRKKLLVGK